MEDKKQDDEKEKKVPKIRFKGFTDDWKQCKFSEFTWNAGKKNKDDLDLEPYAITNEHGFIRQSEAHDDFGYMKDTDRKAYNIVMPNSFAYNPARINVGSIGYYEGSENVIVSSLYEVFQTADYVDDRFLWHWFKSDEFPKWIEKLQEGSVRLYFYYDKLCECQMLMPCIQEQKKISKTLDNLDNLITLYQRKSDELKEVKKYMLQKMFPKNGETKPEIRFTGFTDDWKQCKLNQLADYTSSSLTAKDASEDGLYDLYDANSIIGKTDDKAMLDNYITIIKDGASVGRIRKLPKNTMFIGTMGAITTKENDLDFIYSLLERTDLTKGVTGSTIPHIYFKDYGNQYYSVPNIKEQRKIGVFFSNLDNLITLHQRKCDELKELKKYMLQNMFPRMS